MRVGSRWRACVQVQRQQASQLRALEEQERGRAERLSAQLGGAAQRVAQAKAHLQMSKARVSSHCTARPRRCPLGLCS